MIEKLNLDINKALLITDRINRKYFLGTDVEDGVLLISKTPVCFVDSRYYYAVKKKVAKLGFIAKLYSGIESILKEIQGQDIKQLYLSFESISVKEYNWFKSFNIPLIDGSDIINQIRAVKAEKEIKLIKKACNFAKKAVDLAFSKLKVGVTEKEIKECIVNFYRDNGLDGQAFDTIVAFNKNSAIPHHKTSLTRLKNNSVVLIDTGCIYKGYCSDITRTAFFGKPNKKFIDRYNAVLQAGNLSIKKISAGTLTNSADGFAREFLKKKNLSKHFTHSLGHGIGLEIHEYPTLSYKTQTPLKENMVFSIEPGVYFNGQYGIRIEDTVVIKNGKVKRLFNDSKKLIIL